jgi:putative transposase
MERTTQRRLSAKAWPGMVARFEESGLTAVAFCEREGISSKSFYRWRLRLRGPASPRATDKGASVTNAAAGFIDLGALRSGTPRLDLRLDLGGGMLLHLVRE